MTKKSIEQKLKTRTGGIVIYDNNKNIHEKKISLTRAKNDENRYSPKAELKSTH